jgi:hypothetical protein
MEKSDDELNDSKGKQASGEHGESVLAKILRHWESKTPEERQEHLDKINQRRVEEKLREFDREMEEESRNEEGIADS